MRDRINQLLSSIDLVMDSIVPGARAAQNQFEQNLRYSSRTELYQEFNRNLARGNFSSAECNLRRLMNEAGWNLWQN